MTISKLLNDSHSIVYHHFPRDFFGTTLDCQIVVVLRGVAAKGRKGPFLREWISIDAKSSKRCPKQPHRQTYAVRLTQQDYFSNNMGTHGCCFTHPSVGIPQLAMPCLPRYLPAFRTPRPHDRCQRHRTGAMAGCHGHGHFSYWKWP